MAKRKNIHAVALGRKGGRAAAKTRLTAIPPERRVEIARAAAVARWGKYREKANKTAA